MECIASQAGLFRAVAELNARESREEEELLPELLQREKMSDDEDEDLALGQLQQKLFFSLIHVRLAQRLRGRAWLARLR